MTSSVLVSWSNWGRSCELWIADKATWRLICFCIAVRLHSDVWIYWCGNIFSWRNYFLSILFHFFAWKLSIHNTTSKFVLHVSIVNLFEALSSRNISRWHHIDRWKIIFTMRSCWNWICFLFTVYHEYICQIFHAIDAHSIFSFIWEWFLEDFNCIFTQIWLYSFFNQLWIVSHSFKKLFCVTSLIWSLTMNHLIENNSKWPAITFLAVKSFEKSLRSHVSRRSNIECSDNSSSQNNLTKTKINDFWNIIVKHNISRL